MRLKALFLLLVLIPAAFAAEPNKEGKFIRVLCEDGQPAALETSIAHYVSNDGDKGIQLDLVGVVHIGDKGYYRKLNKQFEQYDVVLYELVAPEGTRVPKGGKKDSDNPMAQMQKIMTMVLRLEHQLEHIDYTKKNFTHADLSPEGMQKAMAERGDDRQTVMLSIMVDMLRKQNLQGKAAQALPADLELSDLLNPTKLKRIMAQQMEASADGKNLGKTINQILVEDRNKACLKVLQREIAAGKKKIAIFYGAAHMPDFDKRLKEEFGLRLLSEDWLQAWLLE